MDIIIAVLHARLVGTAQETGCQRHIWCEADTEFCTGIKGPVRQRSALHHGKLVLEQVFIVYR